MKILLIDDDPEIRSLAAVLLRQRPGTEVLEARGGREGLQAAREHAPDLVLLDATMPDVDGLEVMTRLAASPPSPPVIFLTAHRAESDVRRFEAAGAAGVIGKPFNPLAFWPEIDAILESEAGGDAPFGHS